MWPTRDNEDNALGGGGTDCVHGNSSAAENCMSAGRVPSQAAPQSIRRTLTSQFTGRRCSGQPRSTTHLASHPPHVLFADQAPDQGRSGQRRNTA